MLQLLPSPCPFSLPPPPPALLSDCSFLRLCSGCSSLQECQCSGFRYCMLTQKLHWKYTLRRIESNSLFAHTSHTHVSSDKQNPRQLSRKQKQDCPRRRRRTSEVSRVRVRNCFHRGSSCSKADIIRTPSRVGELSKIMPCLSHVSIHRNSRTHLKLIGI